MSEVDYAENYMEQDDYSDNESSEGNDLKVSRWPLTLRLRASKLSANGQQKSGRPLTENLEFGKFSCGAWEF